MKTKWLLGYLKGSCPEPVMLEDFSWDCGWYWSGGYIGNRNFHAHFDGAFLDTPDIQGHCLGNFITPWTKLPDHIKSGDCVVLRNGAAIWEPLSLFLADAQYDERAWWRIKDLFKQFYCLRNTAEVFQYGGHCTPVSRNATEIDLVMARNINKHIETVIIPEVRKALTKPENATNITP